MVTTIKCPHCKENFEITEALKHQLEEEVAAKQEGIHREEIEKVKKEAEEKIEKKLKDELDYKLKNSSNELEESKKRNRELQTQLLELNKIMRELKEADSRKDLEREKKLNEELEKMREEIGKTVGEKARLRELELEKKLNDTQKALEEAQRKSRQDSQQLQGEILELDLENILRNTFLTDVIEPVEKGVRGADLRQIVKTPLGNTCGVILWESKRTKAWTDSWIAKLKDDLRAEKANVPIIVSTVLPKEAEAGFGIKDGVWICSFSLVIPLAEIIRQKMIEVAKAKFQSQNKEDKKEDLYQYVVGHEFRQHVEALVEVYKDMQDQILKERSAFEKIWKSREAQVQKILKSTVGIVGDMQGRIGGSSMGQIKGLDMFELESGE